MGAPPGWAAWSLQGTMKVAVCARRMSRMPGRAVVRRRRGIWLFVVSSPDGCTSWVSCQKRSRVVVITFEYAGPPWPAVSSRSCRTLRRAKGPPSHIDSASDLETPRPSFSRPFSPPPSSSSSPSSWWVRADRPPWLAVSDVARARAAWGTRIELRGGCRCVWNAHTRRAPVVR